MDVFLNDIHVGSRHAPCPLEFLPKANSATSRYLTTEFLNAVKLLPRKINRLHLVGDIADGPNPKNQGVGCWTTDPCEQVEWAVKLLKPLADRARKVIRYCGTPYHETNWKIHGELKTKLPIATENDGLWVQDIRLNGGVVMNVAHHPMGCGTLYMGTGLDREQVWSAVSAGAGKVERPQIIVRGHRHTWGRLETEVGLTVFLPCWKLPSPHEIKANYWRFHSSIGLVTMEDDARELYGHRFQFHRVSIPMPKVRDI